MLVHWCTGEVHELSQQLDGRLRAEHLERRHVEVVDEEHLPLGGRRTEHAATTTLQLVVYHVLSHNRVIIY